MIFIALDRSFFNVWSQNTGAIVVWYFDSGTSFDSVELSLEACTVFFIVWVGRVLTVEFEVHRRRQLRHTDQLV